MTEPHEVLVVGAGIAGSALAAHLAQAGRRVLLVEKGDFPRDKLCGEFLSTESERLLEDLGVWGDVRAIGPAPIEVARFSSAGGRVVEVRLPGRAHGLSRRRLDELLFRHAEKSGAETMVQTEITGLRSSGVGFVAEANTRGGEQVALQAGLLVGAQGRKSRLDLALDRPFAAERHAFVGLKRHQRPTPALAGALEGVVEVHTFEGGYCGMSLVEDGILNVCMLLEGRAIEGLSLEWTAVIEHLGRMSPSLAARFGAMDPVGETLAVAQVPFVPKERALRGALFIGDAAGVIAPLTGDGQAMALESAGRLAELIKAGVEGLAERWPKVWRRRFGPRMRLSKLLQDQLLAERRAELVFRIVGRAPGLADRLARWTRSVEA